MSYTRKGGFSELPKRPLVGVNIISRMGTRKSGLDPTIYTFRLDGKGIIEDELVADGVSGVTLTEDVAMLLL
ncbi:MAG: hypothetical protein NVS4B11_37190 [Ktedonobacteraceae bacterium]